MAGVYGADVAQLRELARAFDAAGSELSGARIRVGEGIRISAWVGPVAIAFRVTWDSEASRSIAAAARALQDAALSLRQDADEQDTASRPDAGAAPAGAGSAGSADDDAVTVERLYEELKSQMEAAGLTFDAIDSFEALKAGGLGLKSWSEIKAGLGKAGGIASIAGLILTLIDFGGAIKDGDTGGQVRGALDTLAALGGFVFPPTSIAWFAGTKIGEGIYAGVNTFYDSPGGGMAQGARYMFGNDVILADLTAEQKAQLASRYNGLGGFGLSIIDGTVGAANDFGYWLGTR